MIKVLLVLAVLPGVLAAGCGGKPAVEESEAPVPVEVSRISRGLLTDTLPFVGDIRGARQVQVFPRVDGKLKEYTVREGDYVRSGDAIALIDRDITGYEYAPAPVETPISGVIAKLFPDAGDRVSPGSPVAIVADIDEVVVRINVSEKDYPSVEEGMEAVIRADALPGEDFRGEVTRLSRLIDPASRTASAEITVPNPRGRLVPGMFARIDLVLGERESLLAAPDAVFRRPGTGSYYSFVVENGKARRARVEPGVRTERYTEIVSGLEEGDLAVVSGHGLLETGTPVEIMGEVEE